MEKPNKRTSEASEKFMHRALMEFCRVEALKCEPFSPLRASFTEEMIRHTAALADLYK